MFGQIVIGPAGSGKTTYCNGMSQFFNLIGRLAFRTFPVPHFCTGVSIALLLCEEYKSWWRPNRMVVGLRFSANLGFGV